MFGRPLCCMLAFTVPLQKYIHIQRNSMKIFLLGMTPLHLDVEGALIGACLVTGDRISRYYLGGRFFRIFLSFSSQGEGRGVSFLLKIPKRGVSQEREGGHLPTVGSQLWGRAFSGRKREYF